MNDLIRQNRPLFTLFGLLMVVATLLLGLFSKEELIRWVNAHNSPAADYFFSHATYLGDGAFFVIVIVILLIRSRRLGLLAGAVFALSSLLSILLKQVFFGGEPRPLTYFEHSAWQYHVVEGLQLHRYNSFPSGHTITAFAVFTLFALLDERKGRAPFFLLLATLAGYSRVYLFQHFVADVVAGALIGFGSAVLTYYLFARYVPAQKTQSRSAPSARADLGASGTEPR